jgi:Tol biopolymer transport system component
VYYVMNADGTNVRSVVEARSSSSYLDVPSWSPDGQWIVAVVRDPAGYAPVYGKLALVNVETGIMLPLGWTKQLMQPSWRPRDN